MFLVIYLCLNLVLTRGIFFVKYLRYLTCLWNIQESHGFMFMFEFSVPCVSSRRVTVLAVQREFQKNTITELRSNKLG